DRPGNSPRDRSRMRDRFVGAAGEQDLRAASVLARHADVVDAHQIGAEQVRLPAQIVVGVARGGDEVARAGDPADAADEAIEGAGRRIEDERGRVEDRWWRQARRRLVCAAGERGEYTEDRDSHRGEL